MNKKQLYESIMRSVSSEVKKALNEENIFDNIKKGAKYISNKLNQTQTFKNITLILDNNDEILFEDLTDDMNPIFIKISNKRLESEDAEILIPVNYDRYVKQCKWAEENVQLTNDNYLNNHNYLDGYENCKQILHYAKYNGIETPAVKYACNLSINGYKGYLPSIGQLEIIVDYIEDINYILSQIGGQKINVNSTYWSSTENSVVYTYVTYQGGKCAYRKNNICKVLPIFK